MSFHPFQKLPRITTTMTIGGVHGGAAEVDYFSLHNRKPRHIDIEMLDYGYVAKCSDMDELKGILAVLRSGKEGRYPQLESATEDRILALLPAKERVKIERMRSGPSDGELISEKEKLIFWITQADEVHKALQDEKAMKSGKQLPPVRGQKIVTPDLAEAIKPKPLITEVTDTRPPKKAIPAYDFRAWEKYDVENAINEIEKTEERLKEQAHTQREQQKKRECERKKELASLPAYIDLNDMSEAERKILARVEKEKGNDSFRANENEEALLYYTRSIAFDDSDAVLYSNRAAAHLRIKNFAQAEEDCSRAIALDPSYCKAWRRRGMTRFRRGKYPEAISDFEHSLTLEPGNPEVEKLLKKTVAKWTEVNGTVHDNQATHNEKPLGPLSMQTVEAKQLQETTKPFKRFEIVEDDDDEDDDTNAPTDGVGKSYQRFEIIEE